MNILWVNFHEDIPWHNVQTFLHALQDITRPSFLGRSRYHQFWLVDLSFTGKPVSLIAINSAISLAEVRDKASWISIPMLLPWDERGPLPTPNGFVEISPRKEGI